MLVADLFSFSINIFGKEILTCL